MSMKKPTEMIFHSWASRARRSLFGDLFAYCFECGERDLLVIRASFEREIFESVFHANDGAPMEVT
jgi:hypothetical protein